MREPNLEGGKDLRSQGQVFPAGAFDAATSGVCLLIHFHFTLSLPTIIYLPTPFPFLTPLLLYGFLLFCPNHELNLLTVVQGQKGDDTSSRFS